MSGADHPYCLKVLFAWLPLFLLAQPQNIQSLKSSCSRDPKALKTQRGPRAIVRSHCFVSPIKSSKSLSTTEPNSLSIHCSLMIRQDFGVGDQPWIKQLLTQNIEDCCKAKKRLFVDLTSANDTFWYRSLTYKLLRLLPDKHIIQIIMKFVKNRSFTLTKLAFHRNRS